MPSGFYILLRYFLRIDNVMLRVNDTRIYHEFGQDYMLREYTSREAQVTDLEVFDSFLFFTGLWQSKEKLGNFSEGFMKLDFVKISSFINLRTAILNNFF